MHLVKIQEIITNVPNQVEELEHKELNKTVESFGFNHI